MFAAEKAHFNIIKLLIKNGTKTKTFGRKEKLSPLTLLIANYENNGINHDYWQCMDYLLENTSSIYYKEAIEETYYQDFKEVFLYLLDKKIIPYETISNVISPLIKNFTPHSLGLKREIHKICVTKKIFDKLDSDLKQKMNLLNNNIKSGIFLCCSAPFKTLLYIKYKKDLYAKAIKKNIFG